MFVMVVFGIGLDLTLPRAHFDTYQEADRLWKAGKLQEALTGFEEALQQTQVAKGTRWIFYSAYRISYLLSDLGQGERA